MRPCRPGGLALISLFFCFVAHAATYPVTSTHASGTGSLAAAITSANSNPGKDTITFNLPGTSVAARTIYIDSDSLLPNITSPVVIDGTTQPTGGYFGVSPAKVRIAAIGNAATCLAVNANDCEVYGLWMSGFQVCVKVVSCDYFTFGKVNKGNVLTGYTTQGIRFTTSKESSVVGCFVGVDTTGLAGTAPFAVGVFVETNSKKVTIGGKSDQGRNIISGNYIGVRINNSKFITVQQCYIGTDMNGAISVPNTTGILVNLDCENITIGGDSVKYRNIISGNYERGIEFEGSTSFIKGNYIGTDVSGKKPLGNGTYGIYLRNQANDNTIGDTTLYGGNLIAYNGSEAIYFESNLVKNIRMRGNRMFCNSQLSGSGGINVNNGNQGLKPPTITIVTGSFITGSTYPNVLVDLYTADSCTTCEGADYVLTVVSDNSGIFSASIPIKGKITATANDPYGNTSQFADCKDTTTTSCIFASIFSSSKKTCSFYNVSFVDQSITTPGTSITQWFWDFGDGQTATVPNPVISYSNPGVYTVLLEVKNNQGCSDTATFVITVNEGVMAVMQVDSVVCKGVPVHFVDLSYAQGSSYITSLTWTLGDGNSSAFSDFYYTYAAVGQYNVKLQVVNNVGCSSTDNEKVQVRDYPKAKFGVSPDPCVVTPVAFTDLSNPPLGSTITSWFWNFGDGSTSTLQNPQHLFTASGTYAISLTVTDQFGCSDDTIVTLNILAGAIANFTWYVNGLTVFFNNTSTFNPEFSVQWNFGDGTSSNLLAPAHTYSSLGTYTVCLIVFDYTCDMSDTLCQTILLTG
ncbi:MAG: PKD domain-containing protein, partial [Chitinophagales bacterium]|nr:PKD domain-containing protein [Chitinophagales bacterium]